MAEDWVRARGPARGPAQLSVSWGGRPGTLYVADPGRHALAMEGEPVQFDPGPGRRHSLAGLWRALDLFAVTSAGELGAVLGASGLDLRRSGYARSFRSEDGVALVVGARGEGEPGLPQVHFSRAPLRPVVVQLSPWTPVRMGDPGPEGWPAWFDFGDAGVLRVFGPPRPSPAPPAWADRLPSRSPRDPHVLPLPAWKAGTQGVPP